MNLRDCPLATKVCIEALNGAAAQCLRLLELGLYPGQCVEAIYEGAFGRRVIAAGHQRIAIDPNVASSISVAVA